MVAQETWTEDEVRSDRYGARVNAAWAPVQVPLGATPFSIVDLCAFGSGVAILTNSELAGPNDVDQYFCDVWAHDGATLQESDLMEWCKERLAGYKRPRSYAFIAESEMPRNATGKVLHRELKKKLTK